MRKRGGAERTATKERPIIFSAPMVRAILGGRKTQTRRIIKPQPASVERWRHGEPTADTSAGYAVMRDASGKGWADCGPFQCPYGQPGDRLWVKETTIKVEDHGYTGPCYVESDEGRAVLDYGLSPSPDDCTEVEPQDIRKRSAIYMPRNMSRILLEVTAIRVERLQDISPKDAVAEGCTHNHHKPPGTWNNIIQYQMLWESINGLGSWDANPWVWVIEFRRIV